MTVQRMGSVLKVKPEKLAYYLELHANPWPAVNEMIKECNLQNYSIFLKDDYLFTYCEYTGTDYEADMAKMAADSTTQKWWDECIPCLIPLETRQEGELWAGMEQVYFLG